MSFKIGDTIALNDPNVLKIFQSYKINCSHKSEEGILHEEILVTTALGFKYIVGFHIFLKRLNIIIPGGKEKFHRKRILLTEQKIPKDIKTIQYLR